MKKTDCFGYSLVGGRTRCTALRNMLCRTGKCSFYKPKEQFLEERKKYPYYNPIDGKLENKTEVAGYGR